ncbi:hypothetical protein V1264_023182 [Littorina saxatilis]|uniref:Synaptonemal complex central element protein 2 n=1 Tax=Littorina saxatilis TaxID=31220 RepID=A0AAN9B785_9CAEN
MALRKENDTEDIQEETTAASLSEQAQQIVNGLNDKRKQDTEMLAELKSTLFSQVENVCSTVEQHMYLRYEKHGKEFNDKVQELFECLGRVAKLERELSQFKQDLTSFCNEME